VQILFVYAISIAVQVVAETTQRRHLRPVPIASSPSTWFDNPFVLRVAYFIVISDYAAVFVRSGGHAMDLDGVHALLAFVVNVNGLELPLTGHEWTCSLVYKGENG
jgi:hypothetical protein